ncbi:thioredoxin family protein [uncultured Oscillibacter sp.]|uniref:thioredoxin family protein n=1 Tax=uncultured Oscillibacter sp. TaxID=876091 RepID=UPI00280BD6A8|nr:thioredoxin family protein [uncultured Oscillibacter sp.]
MNLFGKKKQEAAPVQGGQVSGIQVLGSGCAKCNALEDAVKAALAELGQEPVVEHVTDFVQIAAMGVMTTPALAVDGRVVSSGRVLTKEEAKQLIQEARKLS